ncbi:MAG: ABC transporter ATP-binding protein [Myxococcaceae bacterium]
MIEAVTLSKQFASGGGLVDVSFKVAPGEVVGLLGRNGAGKTTCLRLLAGALRPDGGQVRVGGEDVWAHPAAKRQLGYLPEAPMLWPELTVHQTLAFGARLKALPLQEVAHVLGDLGLETLAKRRVGELSKGQRQKVALAFAGLGRPLALLLDEPTDGLDPAERLHVQGWIRRQTHSAVLVSSHILPEVSALCSRALVLVAGRLTAQVDVAQAQASAELESAFMSHAA